ncbi:MAG: hypothetical protein ABSF69_21030 [Polyangiaceae bacterium]
MTGSSAHPGARARLREGRAAAKVELFDRYAQYLARILARI